MPLSCEPMTTAPRRRRLDPQVRRDLILDETARVVASEGLAAVNMERIGREAGVSKALVYNYFPTKTALLSGLLLREYERFKLESRMAAEGVSDFETLVRVTTRAYLHHVAERGIIIQRLMNEPSVASSMRSVDAEGRQRTIDFFSAALRRDFELDPQTAVATTDILMGLTGAAGDFLARQGGTVPEVEALVVEMIMAAVRQVAVSRAPTSSRASPRGKKPARA